MQNDSDFAGEIEPEMRAGNGPLTARSLVFLATSDFLWTRFRDEEVAGPNPVTPTITNARHRIAVAGFCIWDG
jgi:hypothetical protein